MPYQAAGCCCVMQWMLPALSRISRDFTPTTYSRMPARLSVQCLRALISHIIQIKVQRTSIKCMHCLVALSEYLRALWCNPHAGLRLMLQQKNGHMSITSCRNKAHA